MLEVNLSESKYKPERKLDKSHLIICLLQGRLVKFKNISQHSDIENNIHKTRRSKIKNVASSPFPTEGVFSCYDSIEDISFFLTYPLINTSVYTCILPNGYLSTCPSKCLFIHLSIHPSVFPFIHSSLICSLIQIPLCHLLICSTRLSHICNFKIKMMVSEVMHVTLALGTLRQEDHFI